MMAFIPTCQLLNSLEDFVNLDSIKDFFKNSFKIIQLLFCLLPFYPFAFLSIHFIYDKQMENGLIEKY